MSKQDDPSERKKQLEALLTAIAYSQGGQKAATASPTALPASKAQGPTPSPTKAENKKLVDALFASYNPKPGQASEEARASEPADDLPERLRASEQALAFEQARVSEPALASEPVGQESWAKRQRYLYPPIIPEDIAASIIYGVAKGYLDPLNDPVAVELMNPGELRKTIQAGRLNPADLPLLKYRIDKLLGLTISTSPPSGQEMLSAQAYHYRVDVKILDALRKGVLEDMQVDYQAGSTTQEEYESYRDEALKIIDQYISSK